MIAVVVPAYVAGALLAFAFGASAIVVLFLPAGLTLAALVLTERRQWPWILAAVAVTEILVDLSQGQSLRFVWGFALANTVEPLVGAWLLRRRVPGRLDLLHRDHVRAFLGRAVVAGPLVGGLIGGTTISVALDRGWLESFLSFWAGDATGVLTVGGSILAWRLRGDLDRAAVVRWVGTVVVVVAVTTASFWPTHIPLVYLPLPVLFLIAFIRPLPVLATSGLAMTVTANVLISAGQGPWAAIDVPAPVKTVTLQLFLATAIIGAWLLAIGTAERDTARLVTSAERAARLRLRALQAVTAQLAKAPTSEAIAETIVGDGVRLIADHGIAGIVTADGDRVRSWATARPPAVAAEQRTVPLTARTPLAEAVRSGTRVVHQTAEELADAHPDGAKTYRRLGIHSGVSVPIGAGDGTVLGAIAFGFTREHAVDEDVIAVAEAVAGLTAQALIRAQLYEREVDAAHQLQRALLPGVPEQLHGVRFAAAYRPADLAHDVGGDWYDVMALPGGRVGFVVGDVVGHDLAAAAAMARFQAAWRIVAQSGQEPGAVLDELDLLGARVFESQMVTIGYADYDPTTCVLRYACAGHPPPLLLGPAGPAGPAGWHYLWGGRSLPVGVRQPGRGHAEQTIAAGSTLVWYTDGLVERRTASLEQRLNRLGARAAELAGRRLDDLCGALLREMTPDLDSADDTVVLCVRFGRACPSAAQPPGRAR